MNYLLLFCLSLFFSHVSASNYFQQRPLISQRSITPEDDSGRRMVQARKAQYLRVDTEGLRQLLAQDSVDLELPLPNGDRVIFQLEYWPIAEQGFLEQFPEIRTFRGVDIYNAQNRGRFEVSPSGFRGMLWYQGERVFIDPEYLDHNGDYISYYANDAVALNTIPVDTVIGEAPGLSYGELRYGRRLGAKGNSDGVFRRYRLAVAVTGEYTAFFGGATSAAAALITTINRVNDVYENDLGITLELVANNGLLIYTDSATDPYSNTGSSTQLAVNQSNLDVVIGPDNYDLGHLFGTFNDGRAVIGATCRDSEKAQGYTGLSNPTGDPFHIDFVSHEIGHQFGANHTFNGTDGSCSGVNRIADNAYEPGSGSTIMAYAGICAAQNLQSNTDPYFHATSIAEISAYVADSNTGGSCGITTTPLNAIPDADAGPDVTIPANTPFVLTGSATDDDADDDLTYVWEQFDPGSNSGDATGTPAEMVDNSTRPLFRSVLPTRSPIRYFPRLADVVSGGSTLGETYPTSTRALNFRLTVRDNSPGNGATAFDNTLIAVTTGAGPFTVTVPSSGALWNVTTDTVSWNVANTDSAPVNCSSVDILLSTDNGGSFATVLLANTANDGTEQVPVPNINTSQARVMVRCSDNVFYAVNDAVFQITTSGAAVTTVGDATADEGNNLSFSVSMTVATTAVITSTFTITDGTTMGDDYSSATFSDGVTESSGLLTIPTGLTSFTVTIPTLQDDRLETDETLTLAVGGITATGTIEDNDSISVASISDSSADEGGRLNFEVELSSTTIADTNFSFAIADVTTSASDYGNVVFSDDVTESSNTLTVPSGVSRFTVSVEAINDAETESGETFTLTVGGQGATGTIGTITGGGGSSGGGSSGGGNGSDGGAGNAGAIMTMILVLLAVYRRRWLWSWGG